MPSRGQSLTIGYVAWDTAANAGKTGDAGNHSLRWIQDGSAISLTNSPAEVDPNNAPGVYKIALTSQECTCHVGVLCGKSSTANVSILPVTIAFEQLPTAAAEQSGGLPLYDDVLAVLLSVDVVKDKVNNLPDEPAAIFSPMTLTAEERAAIADAVLSRNMSHVEAAAPEHSLCTVVLAALESSASGSTWTIKRTDGTTTHAVKTITKDAGAEPITGVS